MCTITPAEGGQFGASTSEVEFWVGNGIGRADLSTGAVSEVARVPEGGVVVAYSHASGEIAYRVPTHDDGFVMHLYRPGGQDRLLYTQDPIGAHGGPPCGPYSQVQFSHDGSELLDYTLFRPTSGPANLLVFKSDGSLLFSQAGGGYGVWGLWSPGSSLLYFPQVNNSAPPVANIESLDATGHASAVATAIKLDCWPVIAPDGNDIVYEVYDSSAPYLPHRWRLDLTTHAATKLGASVVSQPVFVAPSVVWVNENQPCDCGPGGPSAPDGVVLAHDLTTGLETHVDLRVSGQTAAALIYSIIDVRLS